MLHATLSTVLDYIGHYFPLLCYFGTNLLTRGPAQNCCFLPILGFRRKGISNDSKRNETFGNVIFGTNMIQRTWSGRQEITEEATRQGGAPAPWARPHPRGPLAAPSTYFFLLYVPIYPENIQEHHETLFPPPQPFVPVRSHLGAFSGAPPEGESITEGFYINTIAPPMMCE